MKQLPTEKTATYEKSMININEQGNNTETDDNYNFKKRHS